MIAITFMEKLFDLMDDGIVSNAKGIHMDSGELLLV